MSVPPDIPEEAEKNQGEIGSDEKKNMKDVTDILQSAGITPQEASKQPAQQASVDDLAKTFVEKPGEESVTIKKPQYEKFVMTLSEKPELTVDLLKDVSMHLKVELGKTKMNVEDILKLSSGSVIELDKFTGDVLDIYVNDRLVARGEILVINDNFAIRVTEIVVE